MAGDVANKSGPGAKPSGGQHRAIVAVRGKGRVSLASTVQRTGIGPGLCHGIVKFRGGYRQKGCATCDQHFSVHQQRGRVLPPELTHGPDPPEGAGCCD
jgi:hypothetical protein